MQVLVTLPDNVPLIKFFDAMKALGATWACISPAHDLEEANEEYMDLKTWRKNFKKIKRVRV